MKANIQRIRKSRVYSIEFKKELVSEFESGKFSVMELSRLHGIPFGTIYRWVYEYSPNQERGYRVVEMKDSSSKKVKDLERRIRELEAMLGRKQIEIDYLETMMEVAKEELDIDIKKNFGTPPSGGSGKTRKG